MAEDGAPGPRIIFLTEPPRHLLAASGGKGLTADGFEQLFKNGWRAGGSKDLWLDKL